MSKIWAIVGASLGALSVMIGAFGAHSLKNMLTINNRIDTFETAARYHMYHAIAILVCGILLDLKKHNLFSISSWLFLCGIIIFSGSLYALSISGLRWLGAITPIGGICFITGWILLAVALYKTF
ncbi:MAG: DUF423 domain-containing protein [Bacteroidota bacterium]|nr:DUF423 domain-containing protein [Bacteroidota bacterium]